MPSRICAWLGSVGGGGKIRSARAEKYLTLTAAGSELKANAVRAGATTVMSHALMFGMHVVSTIILARLLTPRDFGLVTMVTTLSLFLQNIGANGFTEAIIQRATITHNQLSTLFWINVGVSTLLTLVFIFASTFVAQFYHEPELKAVSAAIAFSILVGSLGTNHLALLKRNMEFAALNFNLVVARAVSLIVAITAAWMGWGYWALVAGVLLLPLSMAVGAWLSCDWRPGLPSRGTGVLPMIKYTFNTLGYLSANYIGRNQDNLLIGWCYGSVSLGNYKRAYDLFALPVSQIASPLTSVALATLSRLRDDPDRYRRYYLKAVSVLAFVGMGLGAVLTLTGKDLVRLLLGPKWEEAGRIFSYFGPGIGVSLIYFTNGWLHLSLGRSERWFRWGLLEMVVTGLLFVIALPYGSRGVAVAWVCSFLLLLGPGLSYAGRPIGLRFFSVLGEIGKYIFSASVAGLLCWSLLNWINPCVSFFATLGTVARILILGSLFGGLYLSVLMVFGLSSAFEPIFDVVNALKTRHSRTVPVTGQ